jgi:hypothetical protein
LCAPGAGEAVVRRAAINSTRNEHKRGRLVHLYIYNIYMESFNLSSDSYTKGEIEKLLHLSPPYTVSDIMNSKQRLITKFNSVNLGDEKQRNIGDFIDAIAIRIKKDVDNDVQDIHQVIQEGSNFIIENADRIVGRSAKIENGRIALESKSAPPGNLNPINVRTFTQAMSIDSRFRPNYFGSKSTNYDMVLPVVQKNVVSMRVSSIELPTTYYAISKYNGNNVCLIIDLNNQQHGWLITLPDGNYEQSWAHNSHAFYIETGMNDAIGKAAPITIQANGNVVPRPGGTLLNATTDLTYVLDHVSGKSSFIAPVGGSLNVHGFMAQFNVDSDGKPSTSINLQMLLGWQLGFRLAKYSAVPVAAAAATTGLSEGICLVCGPRYGFISIDDYQKNTGPSYVIAYANSIMQDNIITRINLAELQADVGVYQSSSDPGLSTQLNRTREYFGPVDIQRLHIAIYDEFGRIIDLNFMDWSLTLAFEILYN